MASVTVQAEPTGPVAPAVDNLPQRPEHIPEKFWDAEKGEANYEALAKSYSELEKKLGAPKAEPTPSETPQQPQAQPAGDEVANILSEKGLDPQKYSIELEQNGTLSESSYAELASKGFPKAMVDQYLAGATAAETIDEAGQVLAERDIQEVISAIGDEEDFARLQEWAADNVDDASLATYNDMVNSGNKAQAQAAVRWLNSMYEDANGREVQLLGGKSWNGPSVEPFRSNAQVVEAMRDRRYKTDPAFREEVQARLAVSDIFG